jgi:hypothetical protein
MILTYKYLTDEKRKSQHIKAEMTTNHPASHHGQPVIVPEDGEPLDPLSWAALRYKVVSANEAEPTALHKMGLVSRILRNLMPSRLHGGCVE